MAFYTSRVDNDGVEIERRSSARSLTPSLYADSTSLSNMSECSNLKSGVRYVNKAAYIEKSSDALSISTGCGDGINNEQKVASEIRSDIVPPLDIQSEDNFPTCDCTFSYRKYCEVAKIERKPDLAYETWLSAKKKLMSDAAAKRKKAEEQKRKEMEERKRLAEEKYHSWLESKNRSQRPSQSTVMQTASQPIKPRAQLSEEEVQARLDEWERTKRLEEEHRREIKRQKEQRRLEIEEKRRIMAAEAWEKWIAGADKKPKPVPLNRGIFTLRGTISDIYVNPNEWQPILPINDDD